MSSEGHRPSSLSAVMCGDVLLDAPLNLLEHTATQIKDIVLELLLGRIDMLEQRLLLLGEHLGDVRSELIKVLLADWLHRRTTTRIPS